MSLRRVSRVLLGIACVLLLAAAQHTALTHAVWHLEDAHAHAEAGDGHTSHAGHDHGDESESALCAFHDALAQTLGAYWSPPGLAPAEPLPPVLAAPAPDGRTKAEIIAAVSRGPPSFL